MMDIATVERTFWDVIVVGTGMGGATIGYALAKRGMRVLFCEKGKSLLTTEHGLRGNFAETFFNRIEAPSTKHRETLLHAGRCADEVLDASTHRARHFVPFIGTGTGGSSAIYGAALERFFPQDFRPREQHPNSTDSSLPEEWPITYEDLRPYYEEAERLYRIRGSPDPCRAENDAHELLPPPSMSPPADEMFNFLMSKELHPYRLPIACDFADGCMGCQGFLCNRNCKNDALRICLVPAISNYNAQLVDECDVRSLESDRKEIKSVVCSHRGEERKFKGAIIILSAGALETPCILLRSTSGDWPTGLANNSGLVGKNLMRHFIDLFAVQPKTNCGHPGNRKELAFNDFYLAGGEKFGTVQSFGALPELPIVIAGMEKDLREGPYAWTSALFRVMKPVTKYFVNRMLRGRLLFASIMEDFPYSDNAVALSTLTKNSRTHTTIRYKIREDDLRRIKSFRGLVQDAFSPYRVTVLRQATNNERIAHACGTCRFGVTAKESVLNQNNRCHSVINLYIVDGSFFPSSGGTNPALTIAANALRVARHIYTASNE